MIRRVSIRVLLALSIIASGLSACDWLDGDRAAQQMFVEKERASCANVNEAQIAVTEGDYGAAQRELIAVQERGPQTASVDRAVDVLAAIVHESAKEETDLRSEVEQHLADAAELLCD